MDIELDTIGEIPCQAALIADLDILPTIPSSPGRAGRFKSSDKDIQKGMRIKYVPLLVNSVTEEHHIGGRYLFDTMGVCMSICDTPPRECPTLDEETAGYEA